MFNLARGLISFGHNVTVISHDKSPLPCSGVKIIQVPLPDVKKTLLNRMQKWRMEPYHTWSYRAYKEFLRICSRERFDIVETAEFGAWGRYLLRNSCETPVVVRCHTPSRVVWKDSQMSFNSRRMPLWLRFQDRYEREQIIYADAIVSPSVALANQLSSSWNVPKNRFIVVPNPIDTGLFNPCGSNRTEKDEILYVGRLQYSKGCFDLVESVVPLLKKYPKLSVRFVGMDVTSPMNLKEYGVTASAVIRSKMPFECRNRIIFTGLVSIAEIAHFQRGALCTVVPSRGFENFPYTVLEPMSCGCPVIATDCGGTKEIITDGVDGLLVRIGDISALTVALERLITDTELRESLANEARLAVERRFSIPVVLPQIINLYEDVIKIARRKAS